MHPQIRQVPPSAFCFSTTATFLDVVAHALHVVRAHRLDVHQGSAVVELEFAVVWVVDGVAEVHELRGSADVELEPLEDRDDVALPGRGWSVSQRLLHPAGVDRAGGRQLLDRDLQHLVATELGDAPRHAGPVDQLPHEQQLRHQDREVRARELGVPAATGQGRHAPDNPKRPAILSR